MAGKIIADIIEAPYDSIRMNVGNITVLTANSSGLNYIPTGNVNVTIGGANANLTMNILTANGIKFPATQVASADPNTLDDYEEGTWTPAYTSSGASFSYTHQFGSYTRIGRMVLAQFYLLATASGTTGNTADITGLPFTSVNINGFHQSSGSAWYSGTSAQLLVPNNGSKIELWKGGAVALNTASDVSTKYLVGMVMYQAA